MHVTWNKTDISALGSRIAHVSKIDMCKGTKYQVIKRKRTFELKASTPYVTNNVTTYTCASIDCA
jgi:hypothetical protein